ncbi:MAG: thioredoxin family protein [Bacteroidetes bacterium]|nr:MAG: thioredoxin family protein [Bacteroidota bacterium]
MTFDNFQALFDEVLSGSMTTSPYHEEKYRNFVKLNKSRQNRWLKTIKVPDDLVRKLDSLQAKHWVLITEPWCGDSAMISPLIKRLADQNDQIKLEIQLRDGQSEIDKYLTNGGKAIPKLIMRDESGNDVFVWGPRPQKAMQFRKELVEQGLEKAEIDEALQRWYNEDKGESFFAELEAMMSADVKV